MIGLASGRWLWWVTEHLAAALCSDMLVRRGKSRPLLSIWHRLLLLGNGRLFIQNESGVLVSFKKPRGIMCNATFGIVSLWQARSIMKYPWRSSQGACFLVHDTEWLLFAGNSSASYRN